jgi:hypothetical protein
MARSDEGSTVTGETATALRDRQLLRLHSPKGVAGRVVCRSCAEWWHGRLRRTSWPCETGRLLGVTR